MIVTNKSRLVRCRTVRRPLFQMRMNVTQKEKRLHWLLRHDCRTMMLKVNILLILIAAR